MPETRDVQRLLGVLAHELRTPLGAIIGFQELLAEGLLGPLDERAVDGVERIGTSAAQLRHLLDGLSDLLLPDAAGVELEHAQVDARPVIAGVVASAHALAAGRGVQLEVQLPDRLPTIRTDSSRLVCALDLAVGAAIRGSPGRTLVLAFGVQDDALVADVAATALDPVRDAPPREPGDLARIGGTGTALRLAMAARVLALIGGRLALTPEADGARLSLRVPPLPN